MKSYVAKTGEIDRPWVHIDANGLVLGRLAVEIAVRLMGKHRPTYTPHVDTGDFVVVVNAHKVKLSGNKANSKKYYSHSGYPGGLREVSYQQMLETHPETPVTRAVRGMLPKNRLGRKLIKKLKVYAGPDHPHTAQNPQPLEL